MLLAMNLATVITLVVVLSLLCGAIYLIVRSNKSNGSSCGCGGCSGCAHQCHSHIHHK